ncbi:MAG: hypothetical protein E7399_01645 [Ruminococcaceae bacterium]|nr:hypothetical protein [Oscillospiraceae bacterium]
MSLKDLLWLWGQDPGTHHEVNDNMWKLPGVNKMEPAEGAKQLGIPNMCRIAMGSIPAPPFDNEMEKLKDFKKVVWSVIGDESSVRTSEGISDLDAVLDLKTKYPTLVGGVMDDFFTPARRETYTAPMLRQCADQLHENGMDLWAVIYEHQLDEDILEQLHEFDIVSFWTWKGTNLLDLEKNLEKLERIVTDKQQIYVGCYFWDYGNKCPMTPELMDHQLVTYKKWLTEGRIKGLIFCSNCIQDIGLETIDTTKKWIAELD